MSESQKAVTKLENERQKRERSIKRVMFSLLDLKKSKILYVIHSEGLVKGLWEVLERYNIFHNRENHEILVDLVNDILMDGNDIEYEWTEEQYENFVKFEEEKK